MLGQCSVSFSCDAQAGTAGYVVQDNRAVAAICDRFKVCDQTALGGLVVVRGDRQNGVCTRSRSLTGQLDGSRGVVGAGTGNNRNAACNVRAAEVDDLCMLLEGHGRGLAGGTDNDDCIGTMLDLMIDDLLEFVIVYIAGSGKRGDDGNSGTGKYRLFHSKLVSSLPISPDNPQRTAAQPSEPHHLLRRAGYCATG